MFNVLIKKNIHYYITDLSLKYSGNSVSGTASLCNPVYLCFKNSIPRKVQRCHQIEKSWYTNEVKSLVLGLGFCILSATGEKREDTVDYRTGF